MKKQLTEIEEILVESKALAKKRGLMADLLTGKLRVDALVGVKDHG